MEINKDGFGERMKNVRLALNLKQLELGNSLGLTRAAISAYEKGTRYPRQKLLSLMCLKYKIKTEYLMYGHGDIFEDDERKVNLDVIAMEYGLDEVQSIIISEFIKMPSKEREVISGFILKIINKITKEGFKK